MNKIVFTSLLLMFIVASGCYYDKKEELYPNQNNGDCNGTYTYNNGIKTLVNTNCAYSGCHVAGGISPDLSTYTLLKASINSVKTRAIDLKNMPSPTGMTSCNITKLDNWIKNNMPE